MKTKKNKIFLSIAIILFTGAAVGVYLLSQYYIDKIDEKDYQITNLNSIVSQLQHEYNELKDTEAKCPFGELYCVKDTNGKLTPLFSGDIYKHVTILKDSKGVFYDYQEILLSLNPEDNTFSMDIRNGEDNGIIIKGTYTMDTTLYTYTLEYDADSYNFDKTLKFKIVEEYVLKYIGDSITPGGPTYGDDYSFEIHI
jgi:hypothetical protein